jgi:hypothetical protein
MSWGAFRKSIDKVKEFGKGVWGRVIKPIFKFVSPLAKAAGTAIGGALGGPAGAAAGSAVGTVAGEVMDDLTKGKVKAGIGLVAEKALGGKAGGGGGWGGIGAKVGSIAGGAKKKGGLPAWLTNA